VHLATAVTQTRVARLRDLSDEMLGYLVGVARNKREDPRHRVAAARVVVEEHRWAADREVTPETTFVQLVGGNWPSAARWVLANLDRIRALAGGPTLPAVASSNDGPSQSEQGSPEQGQQSGAYARPTQGGSQADDPERGHEGG
jgi:hypothetical protein